MPTPIDFLALSAELEYQLSVRYGVMLSSKDLWRELGFRSPNAFRQALARGTLNVPVFELQNRRGRFALAIKKGDGFIHKKSKKGDGFIYRVDHPLLADFFQ